MILAAVGAKGYVLRLTFRPLRTLTILGSGFV